MTKYETKIFIENYQFRNEKHEMFLRQVVQLAMNSFDDKRDKRNNINSIHWERTITNVADGNISLSDLIF